MAEIACDGPCSKKYTPDALTTVYVGSAASPVGLDQSVKRLCRADLIGFVTKELPESIEHLGIAVRD